MRRRFREVHECPEVTEYNYQYEIRYDMTVDEIWDIVKTMEIDIGLPNDTGEWHDRIPCIVAAYQDGRYTDLIAKAEIAKLLSKERERVHFVASYCSMASDNFDVKHAVMMGELDSLEHSFDLK